jgi:hypothetical protein
VQRRRHLPLGVALFGVLAGGLTAAGVILDLGVDEVRVWFGGHQFVTAMLGNAIVLLVTYAIVDAVIERREARRWRFAARRPTAEFLAACFIVQLHGRTPRFDELPNSLARTQERGEALRDVLLASPHLTALLEPLDRVLSIVRGGRTALEDGSLDIGRQCAVRAAELAVGIADEASRVLGTAFAVGATGRQPRDGPSSS